MANTKSSVLENTTDCLAPTFWSPLFGMCTDKFGVGWMVSVPGPQM
jgi:uncharacterized glyoxalase superfamily protein PhnB